MTMTVRELYDFLQEVIFPSEIGKIGDEERAEWPLTVAFHWKGETVISDIVSVKINGKTIQLNEDEFIFNWPVDYTPAKKEKSWERIE